MGSKTLKKIAAIAAPIAGSIFLPGLGTALGLGGLTGVGGAATALGGALGGGIGGAAGGALNGGGLSGILRGAALGGTGGYLANGGASDLFGGTALGNTLGLSAPQGGSTFGNLLGSDYSSVGSGGGLSSLFGGGAGGSAGAGASSYAPGQIAAGDIGSNPLLGAGVQYAPEANLSSALSVGSGGGSSFGGLGSALGTFNSLNAIGGAEDDLESANARAQSQLSPYTSSGAASNLKLSELLGTGGDPNSADYGSLAQNFQPGDLTQDPGYQFRLQQGEQGINRSLAAKGGLFSGRAGQALSEYNQGLADQTYQDAYGRFKQDQNDIYNKYFGTSNQGLGAATTAAGLNQQSGQDQASAGIAGANVVNQGLSGLFGGGARRIVGYTQGGQPIYA